MSDRVTNLILIRHGLPHGNNAFLGQTRAPLTPAGWQQAVLCRQRLSGLESAVVFASDLPRAADTAKVMADRSWPLVRTRLLRERSYGLWEGLTPQSVLSSYPLLYHGWRKKPHTVTPPLGEDHCHLVWRIRRFLTCLVPGTVVVVSHLGPIRAIVGLLLGWPPDKTRSISVAYGSLSTFLVSPSGNQALTLNDTCHLCLRLNPARQT